MRTRINVLNKYHPCYPRAYRYPQLCCFLELRICNVQFVPQPSYAIWSTHRRLTIELVSPITNTKINTRILNRRHTQYFWERLSFTTYLYKHFDDCVLFLSTIANNKILFTHNLDILDSCTFFNNERWRHLNIASFVYKLMHNSKHQSTNRNRSL